MTTATWSSRIRHDSDAVYQEWRDEFITKLGVLVTGTKLAADETNITPGAGSRPGTTTEQGYAVYHLADSLHATAPIYIRFGFGTNLGATQPRVQVTVGTSTNGSGVLGGTALTTARQMMGNFASTSDTARDSYMCAHNGFLGIIWKVANSGIDGFLIVNRTCDSTGAITNTGAMVVWGQGSSSSLNTQALRFAATAAAYTVRTNMVDTALGMSPQVPTSTSVGSDKQVFMGWTITPAVAPLFGVCGVLDGEVSNGSSFSVALVGSTPRTYVAAPVYCGPFSANTAGTNYPKFAMLWE